MKKGITPVIAVVLLLLITVGAVASAWGLYQEITSGSGELEQLNAQQAARNTDISFRSAYNGSGGNLNLVMRNTGGEPVNLSEDVELLFKPAGDNEFFSDTVYSGPEDPWGSSCFSGAGEILSTSGSTQELNCDMNMDFPTAGQTVEFRLDYRNVDVQPWEVTCQVNSPGDTYCYQ